MVCVRALVGLTAGAYAARRKTTDQTLESTSEPFPHCRGVAVDDLLKSSDKWFADSSQSFEFNSDQGQPASWDHAAQKAWHMSKSQKGHMHFYGEQNFYYPEMVTYDGEVATLKANLLKDTLWPEDEEIYPGGRGDLGLRNARFASGRIEFSPDAFDMANTRHGAVVMEAAVPHNHGAWPAFWLMPSYEGFAKNYSWATGMEVDIMELWKGPQPTSNVMYNAIQQKGADCGDAGKPPCQGQFTDSPKGPVGLGTDPWDEVCSGCNERLPRESHAQSQDPQTFYGYGFEWLVDLDTHGDVASAVLTFSHLAETIGGVNFTETLAIKLKHKKQKYSAHFRLFGGKWTSADKMIGAWWTSQWRGVGTNYSWDVGYSLWQAWNVAYTGGMYLIINLAVGGDGHCCSQADLERKQGVVMTNDLLNCTEGDSGWGKNFTEMNMRIRSAKFFNFDTAAEYKTQGALDKCYR